MILQVGKQYVRRDGAITGILASVDHPHYKFKDPTHDNTYHVTGEYDTSVACADERDLVSEYNIVDYNKLTLLDTFAIAALQGTLANTETNDNTCDCRHISQQVYAIAKAMLEERKKHQ